MLHVVLLECVESLSETQSCYYCTLGWLPTTALELDNSRQLQRGLRITPCTGALGCANSILQALTPTTVGPQFCRG